MLHGSYKLLNRPITNPKCRWVPQTNQTCERQSAAFSAFGKTMPAFVPVCGSRISSSSTSSRHKMNVQSYMMTMAIIRSLLSIPNERTNERSDGSLIEPYLEVETAVNGHPGDDLLIRYRGYKRIFVGIVFPEIMDLQFGFQGQPENYPTRERLPKTRPLGRGCPNHRRKSSQPQ